MGAFVDRTLQPMLAVSSASVPAGEDFVFEPKYDGIRVLAYATPSQAALITRNGNDRAPQFPEVAEVLVSLARDLGGPVVLDGELVALQNGEIARFQALQQHLHRTGRTRAGKRSRDDPAALIAFDILLSGTETFLHEPWIRRRHHLEKLIDGRPGSALRLGEVSRDRASLEKRARREGWEGLLAKDAASTYHPGQRTGEWIKLKFEHSQEFVVGGWTEPRGSRQYLGSILVGYYRQDAFIYAGRAGTGFTALSLREMWTRLRSLGRATPPFVNAPEDAAETHWVTPRIVVQIRFNEWTRDGRLRHPVFLGFREDREAREVVREG